MLMWPAAMLMRKRGTKNGDSLRTLTSAVWTPSTMSCRLPIPEPTATPARFFSSSVSACQSASARASSAAGWRREQAGRAAAPALAPAPSASSMNGTPWVLEFWMNCLAWNAPSPSPRSTVAATRQGRSANSSPRAYAARGVTNPHNPRPRWILYAPGHRTIRPKALPTRRESWLPEGSPFRSP